MDIKLGKTTPIGVVLSKTSRKVKTIETITRNKRSRSRSKMYFGFLLFLFDIKPSFYQSFLRYFSISKNTRPDNKSVDAKCSKIEVISSLSRIAYTVNKNEKVKENTKNGSAFDF